MTDTRTTRRWRVLLAGLAVAWVVLLFATPGWGRIVVDGEQPRARSLIAALVWTIGDRVCHQRPERSFHLQGHQMAVCGRCLGLYVSGAAALVAGILVSGGGASVDRRSRSSVATTARLGVHRRVTLDARAWWLALAATPTLLTWSLEMARLWDPGTMMRAVAAVPLGGAAGWLIARVLDE